MTLTHLISVPATLAEAGSLSNGQWRVSFAWPAAFSGVHELIGQAIENYFDAVLECEDETERAIALLARRLMPTLAIVQAAYFVQSEKSTGTRIVGGPEFDFLRGERVKDALATKAAVFGPPQRKIRARPLRRLARACGWSPWWRVPKTMYWPDAVGLNHNSLMRSYIADGTDAVRPIYSDELFENRTTGSPLPKLDVDVHELGSRLADRTASLDQLEPEISDRVRRLLIPLFSEAAADGAIALANLRAIRKLPNRVYTGTGSNFRARVFGMEVMRRGGVVIRFDHGGTACMMDHPAFLAQHELAVSTRFVMPTPPAAQTSVVKHAADRAAAIVPVEIVGHTGDPSLDPGPATLQRGAGNRKPRVIYVATAFYGFHQVFPPVMPAPLYLDWQIRLAEVLNTFPIELVCKPHPEGATYGQSPPLGAFAPITTAPFDEVLREADVLIYDYPATTALSIGLSTACPIVLIDHGNMRFNETVRPLIEQRCRIVRAYYDSRNRPTIDIDELRDAVCDPERTVEPARFRELFLGRA